MGIRQTIQEKPQVTLAVVGAVIVVALISIFIQMKPPSTPKAPMSAFYSDDDGVSYFKDDITKVPPFDHGGKTAVGAIVITGNNGKTFVAYLRQFSKWKKTKLDDMVAKNPADPEALYQLRNGLDEVKKPLSPDAKWVPSESSAGSAVASFQAPPDVTQPTQVLEP